MGEAVRNSGIPREEIFVITKLYPNQFSDPEAAIDEALARLDIGYIDMMLLHHPGAGHFTVESAKGCSSNSRFQQSRPYSGKHGAV